MPSNMWSIGAMLRACFLTKCRHCQPTASTPLSTWPQRTETSHPDTTESFLPRQEAPGIECQLQGDPRFQNKAFSAAMSSNDSKA